MTTPPWDFITKRNDTEPPISGVVKNRAGVVDLSGATVRFHMRDAASVSVVDAEADIVGDPAEGIVSYSWQAADTADVGFFSAEFEITFAAGRIMSVPKDRQLKVKIVEDLDAP